MPSVVDICNLALARLGDSATVSSIDPPEGSTQAEHCARFYPIARNSMLELHDWKFSIRRQSLALLNTESFNWSYAYAQPNCAVRLLAVLPSSASSDDDGEEFEAMGDADGSPLILTDLEDATLKYTVLVTDPAKFSPLFVDGLAWLLASHLAGPVLKGDAGAAESKRCLGMAQGIISRATVSDANQRRVRPEHTPDWIGAR